MAKTNFVVENNMLDNLCTAAVLSTYFPVKKCFLGWKSWNFVFCLIFFCLWLYLSFCPWPSLLFDFLFTFNLDNLDIPQSTTVQPACILSTQNSTTTAVQSTLSTHTNTTTEINTTKTTVHSTMTTLSNITAIPGTTTPVIKIFTPKCNNATPVSVGPMATPASFEETEPEKVGIFFH